MKVIEHIVKRAKQAKPRIVLPEATDLRVMQAGVSAQLDGLAEVIFVDDKNNIVKLAEQNGLDLQGIVIKDIHNENLDKYAQVLYDKRRAKGMTFDEANELCLRPLILGALMVSMDEADGMVAGAVNITADVVRSAIDIVGVKQGSALVSSFFLMVFDEHFHPFNGAKIFADCGLVIDPSSEELANIAFAAAQNAEQFLGEEPKVALLSFSSNGSAKHESIEKLVEAKTHLQKMSPSLKVDGEIQFDAAIVPEITAKKVPNSQTEGNANVLIFPNLEAGNIGYKIAERVGQAKAIGPIFQGLKHPVNDLSRGCSEQDVYNVIAVTAVQTQF